MAQVIQGNIAKAYESLSRISDSWRRDFVEFVILIEHDRRNRIHEAEEIHHRLTIETLYEWGCPELALGVANRVPWEIYPFPDY